MKTTIWMVRHGPTNLTSANGWTDVPADLSDKAQVARTAAMIPHEAVVISSDLIRAVETADAVGGDRLRLSHHEDLREFNFGDWEGRDFGEIAKADPEISRQFWERPGDVAPPGGESFNQVKERVSRRLGHLVDAHQGGHILCVAHYGVILTAVAHAAQMPPEVALKFHVDNLSVTRIEYFNQYDTWRVLGVNHVP